MKQEYQQQLCLCRKIYGTILDVIRLLPTDIYFIQSIFLVVVGRTKVAMN